MARGEHLKKFWVEYRQYKDDCNKQGINSLSLKEYRKIKMKVAESEVAPESELPSNVELPPVVG